jgi:hypothetical protein
MVLSLESHLDEMEMGSVDLRRGWVNFTSVSVFTSSHLCGAGIQIQDLTCTRQAFYPWATPSALHWFLLLMFLLNTRCSQAASIHYCGRRASNAILWLKQSEITGYSYPECHCSQEGGAPGKTSTWGAVWTTLRWAGVIFWIENRQGASLSLKCGFQAITNVSPCQAIPEARETLASVLIMGLHVFHIRELRYPWFFLLAAVYGHGIIYLINPLMDI